MTRHSILALALLSLLPSACTEERPAEGKRPVEIAETEVDDSDDRSNLLEGLGYVEFSEVDEAEAGDGLVLHVAERAASGYCLITAIPFATAVLVDSEGQEVRRWSDPAGGTWQRARLLSNGDLAVVSLPFGSGHFVLERRSWDDQLLWSVAIDPHHDVRELEDGTLLVLTWELKSFPSLAEQALDETGAGPTLKDNRLTRLAADGEVLDQLSIGDTLADNQSERPLLLPPPADLASGKHKDVFHCNSLFVMEDAELAKRDPIYALGNVLLSSRHQNLLFIVDRSSGELVWSWSDPAVEWQHEASVLANGNILFFDNGRSERGYSRILEIDPLSREVVWEYRAPNPSDFFSQARGTVEQIDNGNLLVGNSEKGEVFQLDREGRVVWRYLSPHYNEEHERGVVRVLYYEREFIDSL